ncbi:MAG: hypothetical protein FJ222_05430 [Lentisphaerae bacterium]|nr:hypothetical protein [Lentisphaerota bacterium]
MIKIVLLFLKLLRGLAVLCALYFIWQAVVFLRQRPEPYTEAESRAVAAACDEAARRIASSEPGALRIGVAHFIGDRRDAVTVAMRRALAARDGLSVVDGSPIRKFLADMAQALGAAVSLDEALHAGGRVELDAVVAGRVRTEAAGFRGRAVLDVRAYDVRAGRWLLREEVVGVWCPGPLTRLALRAQRLGWGLRLALWLGFVAALPWLTPFGTRWAMARRSNAASFALLAATVAVDLAAGVTLFRFTADGFAAWALFFVAAAACAGYTFWACERVAEW